MTAKGTPVLIAVLSNDILGRNWKLRNVYSAGHGVVQIIDGAVRYTPDSSYIGTDSFRYRIGHGKQNDIGTVFLEIVELTSPPPIPTTALPEPTVSQVPVPSTPAPTNPTTTPTRNPDHNLPRDPMPTVTSTPSAPSSLHAAFTASRTSGVAPLGVFFDAMETSGLAENDVVNAVFSWNFGDPSSGTWATSGKSQNAAQGFVASHVFRQPGVYTVSLVVKDKLGNTSQPVTQTIEVQDPNAVYAASTYCIAPANNPDFSGCPTADPSRRIVTDDAFYAFSYANGVARVLFKRGGVWTVTTRFDQWGNSYALKLTGAGPTEIGAFGNPSLPRPRFFHNNMHPDSREPLIGVHSGIDKRILNLDLGGARDSGWNGLIDPGVNSKHLLYLGMNFASTSHVHVGLNSEFQYVVDSQFSGSNYGPGFGMGRKTALMGLSWNTQGFRFVDNDGGAPMSMTPGKMVISHNVCDAPAGSYCVRSYNGPVVISDNYFRSTASVTTMAQCRTCAAGTNVTLVERNLFDFPQGHAATGPALALASDDRFTVRNNIFYQIPTHAIDMSLGSGNWPGNFGVPNVRGDIYHNTQYGPEVFIRPENTAVLNIRNNITNGINPVNLLTVGSIAFQHNIGIAPTWGSTNTLAVPAFLSLVYSSPDFLKLAPGSAGRNQGMAVPGAFSDFLNVPRPQGGTPDIGAYEQN